MKNFHKLAFALLIIINIQSCEKENVNDETNSQNIQKTDMYARGKAEAQVHISDTEALENNMQWVAFMTAQILIKEVDGANQFVNLCNSGMINNDHAIVKLSDLLSIQQTDQSFRDAFEHEFNIFNDYVQNPCENQGKPKLRPTPPPCDPMPCALPNQTFEAYIDYLLEEHCLEIYVTAGLDLSQNIFSSAHPMNTTNMNIGFEHYDSNECNVNQISIHGSVIGNIYDNLIVVRPYRAADECDYDEFSEIEDFTLFPI